MKLFTTKVIAFYVGCFACYFLQKELHFTAVTAAACIGLSGSFLHFPRFYERNGLHAALYSGAFAGMTSLTLLRNPMDVFILSLFCAILFITSRPFANGFGGRLGTIAFISSAFFFVMRKML